jgi:nucleotide-binding universal stress UspA family protein
MYDHILVPTDGSKEAVKAANHAIELAANVGASVTAMYAIDLPGHPRTVYVTQDDDELKERYHQYGEEVTGEIADVAAENGVECDTVIRSGAVHEEITDYADENDIDLIVLGTGYRGKIGSLLGSVAEKVVRTSRVPVTTVRRLEEEI